MNEIKLKENFYMYQFPPEPERILGQNIFVLFHENECIVFDSGYERHMTKLLPRLEGYNIKYVICTHFHPDHCYGLNVLPKQKVVGSKYALETLTMFEDDSNELLVPSIFIEDETKIDFYGHKIVLKNNPGHSNCGMLIEIDEEFLLIGDDYMTTNKNEPVIPYVASTIEQHKSALLNIISNYKNHILIPSHGVQTNSLSDLEYRVRYLNFTSKRLKDLEEFYGENDIHFKSERWHLLNIQKP